MTGPVEAAGLGFGAAGAAELCLKMFKELLRRYKAFKSAEADVQDSIVTLQNDWLLLQVGITTVQNDAPNLSPVVDAHFQDLFTRLQITLDKASRMIEGIGSLPTAANPTLWARFDRLKPGRRVHYALTLKDCLDIVLTDVRKWRDTLAISLLLLVRSPGSLRIDDGGNVDGEASVVFLRSLRKFRHSFLTDTDTIGCDLVPEFFLSTSLSTREKTVRDSSAVLTKTKKGVFVIKDATDVLENVQGSDALRSQAQLATKIALLATESSGIMKCLGTTPHESSDVRTNSAGCLVFELPLHTSTDIISLRAAFSNGEPFLPLNSRLELAIQISKSLVYLHAAGFVHKNIRPETLILLRKSGVAAGVLGRPYLTAFTQIRQYSGESAVRGDMSWYKNMYRHPSRQGLVPQQRYIMQHDIYSLGVCLLEVGLWEPFFRWQQYPQNAIMGPGLKQATRLHSLTGKGSIDELMQAMSEEHINGVVLERMSGSFKEIFEQLADHVLPSRMGNAFAAIVKSCLTCLDTNAEDDNTWNSSTVNSDAPEIGTRYLEEVITRLHDLAF